MNQDTDWTSVAVYVPPTAAAGIATEIVGFHDRAVVSAAGRASDDSLRGVSQRDIGPRDGDRPGVGDETGIVIGVGGRNRVGPVDEISGRRRGGPGGAGSARLSVTVTGPIGAPTVVPGAPEPRLAKPGAVIVSAPDVTVKVRVVSGSPLGAVAAA